MSIIEFDKQRFDDLYQKYAGMIFRTAYNFLLNKDDAEDIVQEVFIRYFISNKTFNDDNHEKAWILTVTANLSKNVLRSKSRQNLELDDTIKIVDNKFEKAITNHLDLEEAMKKLTKSKTCNLSVLLWTNSNKKYSKNNEKQWEYHKVSFVTSEKVKWKLILKRSSILWIIPNIIIN